MKEPEIQFDWDEPNIGHIARHRVRVVTAFEPIKRLIQLYYQKRER
jgi:hypothetical protein